jgi:CRP-like cAMP-binding protein
MAKALRAHEVFEFLLPEQVNAISDASETISCVAGEMLYEMGAKADYFFTVLSGEVTLRLPGRGGVSIVIDQLSTGDMFGSCVCFERDSYSLTAQCTSDSELLKIKSAALTRLMEEDLTMGYRLQTRISKIYFHRYTETMKKLQAIVLDIPIESG